MTTIARPTRTLQDANFTSRPWRVVSEMITVHCSFEGCRWISWARRPNVTAHLNQAHLGRMNANKKNRVHISLLSTPTLEKPLNNRTDL